MLRIPRAFAAANLQPYRRSQKSKLFAYPVFQEPFVGKVELGRDVGEQRKGRRSDAYLRRIENPHGLARRTRHRMRCRCLLQKSIELWRGDAAAALFEDVLDNLEQLRGALARERGDVNDRRKIQKLQVEAQLVVERLRKILTLPLHQIPFVDGDDHAA